MPDQEIPYKWACAGCDYSTETPTDTEVRCPKGCFIRSGEQRGKAVVLYQTNLPTITREFGE